MSDLMREGFETWAMTNAFLGLSESCMERHKEGYLSCELHAAWLSWQASREIMVIELPEPRVARGYGAQVADALGFNDAINYCEEAIRSAGVKTK